MTANPTKTGYTFQGYFTGQNGTGTQIISDTGAFLTTTNALKAFTSADTTYAHWTANVSAVTLNHSGATINGSPGTVYLKYESGWYSNSGATTPISQMTTVPQRTGYAFQGYFTEQNGAGTQIISNTGAFLTTTNALKAFSYAGTAYAHWTPNTLTINYASGGGTGSPPASPTSAQYGGGVIMPANTYSRTGYKFAGWEVSGTGSISGTHQANAAVAVSALSTAINNGDASITLTATWTEITYTVAYASNEPSGTSASGTTSNSTHTYDIAKALTANGYSVNDWTFIGWNTAPNGEGGGAFSGVHDINYPTTHTYGTVTYLKGATKTDYILAGWFDSNGNALTFLSATGHSGNITLFAKWIEPELIDMGECFTETSLWCPGNNGQVEIYFYMDIDFNSNGMIQLICSEDVEAEIWGYDDIYGVWDFIGTITDGRYIYMGGGYVYTGGGYICIDYEGSYKMVITNSGLEGEFIKVAFLTGYGVNYLGEYYDEAEAYYGWSNRPGVTTLMFYAGTGGTYQLEIEDYYHMYSELNVYIYAAGESGETIYIGHFGNDVYTFELTAGGWYFITFFGVYGDWHLSLAP